MKVSAEEVSGNSTHG